MLDPLPEFQLSCFFFSCLRFGTLHPESGLPLTFVAFLDPYGPICMTETITIPSVLDERSIEWALSQLLGRGRAHAGKLLRQKRVLLGGETAEEGQRVKVGEELVILSLEKKEKEYLPNRRIRFEVLHEDPHLVVLRKPSGLVMHPGPGHGSDSLLNGLLALYEEDLRLLGPTREFGLVHRLDRGTSGIVVVARTESAYTHLVDQFANRKVQKEYVGLVWGRPPEEKGVFTTPVGEKEAVTEYEVEGSREVEHGQISRLKLWPKTGRTHQIRIHLADAGFSILADRRYGHPPDDFCRRYHLTHPVLHAGSLAFSHPETEEALSFSVLEPRNFRRAWDSLA